MRVSKQEVQNYRLIGMKSKIIIAQDFLMLKRKHKRLCEIHKQEQQRITLAISKKSVYFACGKNTFIPNESR